VVGVVGVLDVLCGDFGVVWLLVGGCVVVGDVFDVDDLGEGCCIDLDFVEL